MSAPLPISLPPCESAFSVVRVGPHGGPMSPSRRGDGVVRVTSTSAPCCLRRSGAAYPGRARHGGFIQVVWSPTGRVAGPGSPVSGSLRRRSRQLQVRGRRSFQVASFSRIRLVAESLALRRGRPLTTRSSGPLPQRPCFARLPRAPGSGLPERY